MSTKLVNSIICGDCKERMKQIPDKSVDLVYLDPPFFSGKSYDLIWGDSKATIKSFEDAKFYKKVCGKCGKDWGKKSNGDDYKQCRDPLCKAPLKDAKDVRMNDINVYVEWLKDRLQECYRVLKPTGSIYCHLDWHAVHYVKVAMDDIFGYKNFQNDITWCYNVPVNSHNRFCRKHDTILFYTKGNEWTFNENDVRVPYGDWAIGKKSYKTKSFGLKKAKEIELNKEGKLCPDYWYIDILGSNAKERMGYPTQKPETLLERIILASSNPGDVILDPFCGCGTTITVAHRLKLKWIGIDIEPLSCTIQQIRMEKTYGIKIPVIDLGKTLSEEDVDERVIETRKMDPYEFQDWVVAVLEGTPNDKKSRDGGIDGWTDKPLGNLTKGDLIQVKRSDKVGTDTVKLMAFNSQKHSRERGIIVAFGFTSTAEEEANDIRAQLGIEIELLTVKDMLMRTGKNIKSPQGNKSNAKQKKLSDITVIQAENMAMDDQVPDGFYRGE